MSGVAPAFSRAAAARELSARAQTRHAEATPQARVRDDRYGWLSAGMICVLLLVMIVPEGFDYANLDNGAPAAGSSFSRLIWLGLFALGALLLALQSGPIAKLLRSLNFFLLAFAILAAASVAWSLDASVTTRRLIRVVTILVDSAAFVLVAWHSTRLQNVLRPVLTAVLLGSLMFGLFFPALGVHAANAGNIAGDWHGLANHKNGLGSLASMGLIFWTHAWLSREVRTWFAVLWGGVAALCLILSKSSTAIVASAFTMLFLLMLMRSPNWTRRYMPYAVGLFSATLLLYSIALLQLVPGLDVLLSPINALTGKDATLTGRTDIWTLIRESIRVHPWLGTGYGAYWTGPNEGSPSYEFIARMNFYPASAHNGYLEIVNELGVVGIAVLLG
ncbi:MAG: O-antigen ligase family protein, partial [Dokdonella sp.]